MWEPTFKKALSKPVNIKVNHKSNSAYFRSQSCDCQDEIEITAATKHLPVILGQSWSNGL